MVSVSFGRMIPPTICVPNAWHRCKNVPLCYLFSVYLKRCKSTEKIKISISMTLIWFRLLSNWKSCRDNPSAFILSLRMNQIFQDCVGAIWLNFLNVTFHIFNTFHIFPGQKNDPTFPRDQYNNDGMPEYTLTPDRLVLDSCSSLL